MLGDASQDIGKPGLRINIVHHHDCGTLTVAIGAAEQPAHGALSGIVGQADATIVGEARESTMVWTEITRRQSQGARQEAGGDLAAGAGSGPPD